MSKQYLKQNQASVSKEEMRLGIVKLQHYFSLALSFSFQTVNST